MDGLIVIDKPAGPTSHDVVARMRRVLRERRIGHTGTLDPAATGVLPLVVGRATRLAQFLSAEDKQYEAVIRLGIATDTYDAQGRPAGPAYAGAWPSRDEIASALATFRGSFLQQPPAFSAKRIDGRRSHELARADRSDVRLPAPVTVTVQQLELLACEGERLTVSLTCSAGFYVRALAHDLGAHLGIGAHLDRLRRTRSGAFSEADALPLAVAERDVLATAAAVIPLERMLTTLSAVVLTEEGVRHAVQGRNLGAPDFEHGRATADGLAESSPRGPRERIRLVDPAGTLVGIAEPTGPSGLLHPFVVLV